jgi:hypothetical protein
MEPKRLQGQTIAQQSTWKYYSTPPRGHPAKMAPPAKRQNRPPVRISRTISNSNMAPIAE